MEALIGQSQHFKNHVVTSSLPVNNGAEEMRAAEYAKKPPRSPVVEEDMVKDVNDNIDADQGKSTTNHNNNDQWDFLGDSNNNNRKSTNNNNETEQRSVEAVGGGEKIGFIIENPEARLTEENVAQDQETKEQKASEQQIMEIANSPPPPLPPIECSSAIDINCNICVTDSEASPSSLSSASKDLIEFDSPQHHSSGVRDDEALDQSVGGEQVEMFKLDDEEEDGDPHHHHQNKLSLLSSSVQSSISISQMPDSPASVASMQSTDVDSGCEVYPSHDGSCLTPPSQSSMAKRFKMTMVGGDGASSVVVDGTAEAQKQQTQPLKSERSLSSESLNSEASMESNDSKSSLKLMNSRFSKNGTLERQSSNQSVTVERPPVVVAPTGLQVLVLWNNLLTKRCSQAIADMIKGTSTLEVLNVGKNVLGNEFVSAIKGSLCANESISKLGLQSVHLTCSGAKTVAEVIEAKCG